MWPVGYAHASLRVSRRTKLILKDNVRLVCLPKTGVEPFKECWRHSSASQLFATVLSGRGRICTSSSVSIPIREHSVFLCLFSYTTLPMEIGCRVFTHHYYGAFPAPFSNRISLTTAGTWSCFGMVTLNSY